MRIMKSAALVLPALLLAGCSLADVKTAVLPVENTATIETAPTAAPQTLTVYASDALAPAARAYAEAQGVTLTADVLCEEYRKLNALYYGEDVVLDEEIALEWARIPHFYYNYYVFQYATGYSAAIALSRRILREGEPAVKDYLGFLSGGCSKSPIDLLKGAGVDMTSPEPVNQALALFGELLDEMEALTRD